MKKLFLILLAIGKISMAQTSIEKLEENITNYLKDIEGNFAVAFWNLSSGEQVLINEKENFHAASTMKTPVMIEVFKQAEEGKFNLNDSIIIKNEFKSIVDSSLYSMDIGDDGGEELYKFIGKKKMIRQMVYDMITVSSNLATNILIDLVDAKNVMKTMKEIGAKDIKVLRGVEDGKAFELGMNNTTTAYDLMLIFESIALHKLISKDACKEMIEILLDQKFRSKIPAKLPGDLNVAHKTGNITGVEHDSGIIFLPDGRKYILVLLAKNLKDQEKGVEAEAEVSKMIYDYVMEK